MSTTKRQQREDRREMVNALAREGVGGSGLRDGEQVRREPGERLFAGADRSRAEAGDGGSADRM